MKFDPAGQVQEMVVISMFDVGAADTILTSAPKGERHSPLVKALAGNARLIVFDFSQIEVVSPSYFRTTAWPFWFVPDCYPLLSHVPPDCFEDLELFLAKHNGLVWAGNWTGATLEEINLLGPLAEIDASVVHSVITEGEISAVELAEREQELSLTGWNNRLAELWRQRVLRRKKSGRRFVYQLPWR